MSVTLGAVWADFDGDSFLDLYVGGYENPGTTTRESPEGRDKHVRHLL